jgi:replicative DNA helicase
MGDIHEAITERPDPFDEDAEINLIGLILINGKSTLVDVFRIITADSFYISAHRWIYEASMKLMGNDEPIDILSVQNELKRMDVMDYVGEEYLYELVNAVVSYSSAEYCANRIQGTYMRRQLLITAGALAKIAYDETLDDGGLQSRLHSVMVGLSNVGNERSRTKDSSEYTSDFLELIGDIEDGKVEPRISTGIHELDDLLYGGWAPSMLHTIFARASVGKSLLTMWCGLQAAINMNPVLVFSLEMTTTELMERWVSCLIGIPIKAVPKRLMNTSLPLSQAQRAVIGNAPISKYLPTPPQTMRDAISAASTFIGSLPLEVNDHYSLTVDDIFGEVLARAEKPRVVIVDHVLELDLGVTQNASSVEMAFNGLRKVARGTNTAVIAVSQANRRTEGTDDKSLNMADLFQAGEKPSNVIIGLNRDADDDGTSSIVNMNVTVPKNRGGPRGKFSITVNTSTSSIMPRPASRTTGLEGSF